jgi:ribosomal-protein-alanine N-acetyltransferase
MQRDPEKTPIEKSNNASVLQLNFNPYTSLQTERLNLRQITMADAEDYFLVRSSSEAMKFIGKPLHQSIEETKELIKKIEGGINTNEAIAWALSLKENPKLFGTIGYHRIEKENFRAEIGYMILPEYWNKGLVSEAIKEVIKFGFEKMQLHSIEAKIDPNNIGSAKVLTKSGFTKDAYFKENFFYNGKFSDTEIYSLLKK